MKLLFISLLLAAGSSLAQTNEESFSAEPPPPVEEIHTFVDEEPEFTGGFSAMMTFVQKNVNYPEGAVKKKIHGKCYLRFVVNKDGSISDIQVDRGVPDCPECDREAVRLVKSMPKWKPGKNNGQIVRSYFIIPVNFTFQ